MRQSYDDFLKTEIWKQTTESVYAKAGGQCERCGSAEDPFQAHHLTYKAPNRPGVPRAIPKGWLPDFEWLVFLCGDCHRFFHRLSLVDQFWETRALYRNHVAMQQF